MKQESTNRTCTEGKKKIVQATSGQEPKKKGHFHCSNWNKKIQNDYIKTAELAMKAPKKKIQRGYQNPYAGKSKMTSPF